ncbi:hypothetical protein [Lactococcus petauri]|uniref:hypothetical protein n=1 Tax=Lactococcus petauri TaxID=1940789 RepID=UPI003851D6D2
MHLEEKVEKHEERLKQHDREIARVNDRMAGMQESIDKGLIRVDESNKFLREQNARQSEQNTEILQAVIKRNENSEGRDFQLKMLHRSNFWKMVFAIGGALSAGGGLGFFLETLLKK